MKRLTYFLLIFTFSFVFCSLSVNAAQTYDIKVELLKAYEDGPSMGNAGMKSSAKLIVDGNKGKVRVTMVPLDLMGSKGYLGELTVAGRKARVLSTYSETDSYNDPNNGTDAKMKGKKYPKQLEFPVDLKTSILNCSIYVPVMGEMGVGEQNARIKINYPKNLGKAKKEEVTTTASPKTTKKVEKKTTAEKTTGKTTKNITKKTTKKTQKQTTTEKKTVKKTKKTTEVVAVAKTTKENKEDKKDKKDNKEDSTKKEDKKEEKEQPTAEEKTEQTTEATTSNPNEQSEVRYYSVPVNLWHFVEDKPSMGDGAMGHIANVRMKDGAMEVYISADKMEVRGTLASLISVYYDDGTRFAKAKAQAYDMAVEGSEEMRPEVFSFPMNEQKQFLNVFVDPKVEVMGDDPIKCRLKFDFANMKPIDETEATLIDKANNGTPSPNWTGKEARVLVSKGVTLQVAEDTFDKPYSFYANEIKGAKLNSIKSLLNADEMAKVYSLKALSSLEYIELDAKSPINDSRDVLVPKKQMKIYLPLDDKMKDTHLKVFAVTGDEGSYKLEEISFEKVDGKVCFDYDKLVPFVISYPKPNSDKSATTNKNDGEKSALKSGDSKSSTKSSVIVTSKKVEQKESPELIFLFIFVMGTLLVVGIYFTRKYYRVLIKELAYGEEIKMELIRKSGKGKHK